MTISKTLQFLESLCDEKERDYELSLTSYAINNNNKETIDILYNIIDDNGNDDKISYAAFYCIHIILRRNKDYEHLKKLHNKYSNFKKHITYNHLWFLYLTESDSFYDYDEVLKSLYNDYINIKENAGFSHLFANAYVAICDKCDEIERQPYIEQWYDLALQAVDESISLDSTYAKYYCTKGRIVALKHNYAEATKLIHHAIALEDSSRKDYSLRISDYRYYALQTQLQRERFSFENKIQELKNQLFKQTEETIAYFNYCSSPKAYEGRDPFVFVSYAHSDNEIIYPLINQLIKCGYRIWFDEGVKVGDEWIEFIASKVFKCEQAILFVSNNSINSPNVRKEINFALSENKKIITVFIEDVIMSHGMRMQLDNIQSIPYDIYQKKDMFERKLKFAISAKCQ